MAVRVAKSISGWADSCAFRASLFGIARGSLASAHSRAGFMSEMALCDATAFAAGVHRPPARAAHRPSLLCLARSITHESGVVH